jgi:hypothetical protein
MLWGTSGPWKDHLTLSTARTMGGDSPDESIPTGILAGGCECTPLCSMISGLKGLPPADILKS